MKSPQTDFQPGQWVDPTSRVEVSISCQNLLDKDVFSRSDPMVVVSMDDGTMMGFKEIFRTETVFDNLNPQFTKKLTIDYRFEEEQKLRFAVYDIDAPSKKLEDHDFLGFAECTLARIVSSGYNGLELPLSLNEHENYESKKRKTVHGTIVLLSEELVNLKEETSMQFNGKDLGAGGFFGLFGCSSKYFFTISKVNEAGKYVIVYKSETAPGSDPRWKKFDLSMTTLCNGDKDRCLQIEIFKDGLNGYHTSRGSISASLTKLLSSAGGEKIPLTNSKGQKISSSLQVAMCKLVPIFTFLDFIRGGTQIHCAFAIDMTGSNGDPREPDSLHYISPPHMNQTNPYEQAIMSVGNIIEEYDSAKMFPAFGFGAKIPPNGITSHRFNLNLNNPSAFCSGIHGVLGTYKECIKRVQLFGPTCFAPIIRDVANMALQSLMAEGSHYYILLIITDGILNDFEETKEQIVNASTLPLSIIIVGVGGANFDKMDVLDGDEERLSYNGKVAERDIVQFVPYRDSYSWLSTCMPQSNKFPAPNYMSNVNLVAQSKLAKEVLAEIPDQLVSFMKSRHIKPLRLTE